MLTPETEEAEGSYNQVQCTQRVWEALVDLENQNLFTAQSWYDASGKHVIANTRLPSETIDMLEDSFRNSYDFPNLTGLITEAERMVETLRQRSDFEASRTASVFYGLVNFFRGLLLTIAQAPNTPLIRENPRVLAIRSELCKDIATVLKMARIHGPIVKRAPAEESQPIKTS